MKRQLLLFTMTLAAMMLPQGAWADDFSGRAANGELYKAFIYGTANNQNVVAGGTIGFDNSFPTPVDNFWVLSGKQITCTLAGEEKLAVGDVIKIRAAFSGGSDTYGIRLRKVGGSEGEILKPGSSYNKGEGTYGDIIELTYTVAAESQYVNENAFLVFRSSSSGPTAYVRSITIERSGSDCQMPSILSGEKTWDFSAMGGTADQKIGRNIAYDDLYFGCSGESGTQMYFKNKVDGKTTVCLGSTGSQISVLPATSNGNALMFIVPAGCGKVVVKHVKMSSSGTNPDLKYNVGNTSGTLTSGNSDASNFTEYSFGYNVSVPTPVWIYSTSGSGNSCIRSISVIQHETVTLDSYGFATFASPLQLDLANMSATTTPTAYKASVSGTTVNFTAVSEAVAANTGILLQGGAGETVTIPIAATGTDISATNAFKVNTTGAVMNGANTTDNYFFAMMKNQETLTFATFNPTILAVPANKAYLEVAKSNFGGGARELSFSFGDDNTTSISTIANSEQPKANCYYDLQGRRVAQPTRGLYIVNGKKVVVK